MGKADGGTGASKPKGGFRRGGKSIDRVGAGSTGSRTEGRSGAESCEVGWSGQELGEI